VKSFDYKFTCSYLTTQIFFKFFFIGLGAGKSSGQVATGVLECWEIVRNIRLTKAKALLQNPDLSILAVAYDTGFNDPNYFGRVTEHAFFFGVIVIPAWSGVRCIVVKSS
jgi:AraC-like DNA-binding protein